MSSVLSAYAQIPRQIRYFMCLPGGTADSSQLLSADIMSAVRFPLGAFGPSDQIADTAVSTYNVSGALVVTDRLYLQDLGRSLYVYDQLGAPGSNLLCVYRQVIHVNGKYTEGIQPLPDPTYPFYIKVWSSSGGGIIGTRTG